ncbi:MAG: type VI secretion system amidase effector protein Tae4 [Rhodocyclaceae bacterium]
MTVRVPVREVGKIIGGKVQQNIEMSKGGFDNACPIRMSYVLNVTGFPIPKTGLHAMVSGADGSQYIYRLVDMMGYLERAFGKPDKTVRSPTEADFARTKGIIVVKGYGWRGARGHVTLWNGSACADSCHLLNDPDNGSFVAEVAHLWLLH